ncbi:head decoration protein [Roseomonas indoligenes]|uniref:Head decoration protein n=1 Tax=Roseomonas indoligenes TaxID=2820811 RepID=A0A940S4P5_9PROT|nr:head decoration protein [Pararoseomonas indoligenes]MBP0492175.1 head decoration protein [Pararoseomonas indoligenes]
MPQYPRSFSESYAPDRLIAGLTQIVTENMVLLSGQNLKRGTIVGRITASGKATISAAAASDGSQVPYGILLDDYDATAGDLGGCGVMVKGEFNDNAVIFGAGHTVLTVHDALRDGGIFLKPSVHAS